MDILLTLMGSCRIEGVSKYFNTTNLNKISYLHSTKEHIQFLKYVKGDLLIPKPYSRYCFRDSIMNLNHNYEHHSIVFKKAFNNTTHFIMEICSNSVYENNNFYLHHLAVDERFGEYTQTPSDIIKTTVKRIQTAEEIKQDIIEIQELLEGKKLIVVTHVNPIQDNGKQIDRRNNLVNILENICNEQHISLFNPTTLIGEYQQHDIVHNDLGHLTPNGVQIVGNALHEKIKGEL